jgi:hypothetical protein
MPEMKNIYALIGLVVMALQGCTIYTPDYPGAVVVEQGGSRGGPGNGFCPPGQAKKGNC